MKRSDLTSGSTSEIHVIKVIMMNRAVFILYIDKFLKKLNLMKRMHIRTDLKMMKMKCL
jgi:hypothetical protein